MPINYQKDALENFNLAVIFEIDGGKDIIPCQALFELSRLKNLSDNHSAKIMFFSTNKQENDLLTENKLFERPINSGGFEDPQMTVFSLGFYTSDQNNFDDVCSAIVTTDIDEPLLIFNNLNTNQETLETMASLYKLIFHVAS